MSQTHVVLKVDECWAAAITPSNRTGRVLAGTKGEIQNHHRGQIVVFEGITPKPGHVFLIGSSFDRLFEGEAS